MIRVVAHGSPEYDATVELRRAVLRRPLGLDFSPEQLASEASDTHLAQFEEDQALACLILTPKDLKTLKMRQVAVAPERQGRGLGRLLVEGSEVWGREHGFEKMTLHARDTAVPFYLALGYAVEGEPFEEVGIPHCAMSKTL